MLILSWVKLDHFQATTHILISYAP